MKHDQSSYDEINRSVQDKKVSVSLANGENLEAKNLQLKVKSTSVGDKNIHTNDITKVTQTNSGNGAVQGLVIGLLVGASLGYLYGYVSYDKKEDEENFFQIGSAKNNANVGAVGFGIIGALMGGLAGSQKGEVVTYTFIDYQDGTTPDKLEVQSILYSTEDTLAVLWQNRQIKLHTSEYDKIMKDRTGAKTERIYISIPYDVYNEKFSIYNITTSTEVHPPEKQVGEFIEIEVTSIETQDQYFVIQWNNKRIFLHKSDVQKRKKIGDKIYLTISYDVYEEDFMDL